MTREEAKEKVFENNDGEIFYQATYDFIDKIYDDFESRTCKNCFNLMPFTVDDEEQCSVFIAGMEEFMFKDVSTFGCNSFVSTDTKT